jgi:hypothetical protein
VDGEDAVTQPQQLGFGFEKTAEEERTAHLPATMEDAIPFYRNFIERHHQAMLAGDVPAAMKIREEAHELAVKVNGGDAGICGGPDAPAYVLERATAAQPGTVPIWGQTGSFTIDVDGMKARIEQEGIFGTVASHHLYPGFGAYVVDYDKPAFSETGFRIFFPQAEAIPGITPDAFASMAMAEYIKRERKGKLCKVERTYVEREMARRAEKTPNTELDL